MFSEACLFDNLIMDMMHLIPCFSNHSLICYCVYDEHHFSHLGASFSWPIVASEKENSFLKSVVLQQNTSLIQD